ncbi:MAG: hypothetical protein M1838_001364 [Thelocarpon superellum]|nr:MAG: hypothetical protein M1838_001364 [Thelocarpon superellum]
MPPVRPHLSITLPRNFTFHYTDSHGPKTPEPSSDGEPRQPSPPRAYRLPPRRQRAALSHSLRHSSRFPPLPQDVPIPTIETPNYVPEERTACITAAPEPFEDFLAPVPRLRRLLSPPKTPLAQLSASFDDGPGEAGGWTPRGEVHPAESISRPDSACSIFSDSSDLSSGSSVSGPSNGGSCTSPESEAAEAFAFPTPVAKGKQKIQPDSIERSRRSRPAQGRRSRHTVWTGDMDYHLWTTYLLYLQDPTVTPFRIVHGSAPPLGVCCRVAREAKRSWRGARLTAETTLLDVGTSGHSSRRQVLRDVHDESHAVKTEEESEASAGGKSGSATPTAPQPEKIHAKWPTSESATRRRLRYLCRRRTAPSNPQRLHQYRSPTPLQRDRPRLASPMEVVREQASFSTRDMSFSLATSTAASMRPNGALASLAQDDSKVTGGDGTWMGGAHPPSTRPEVHGSQFGLGIGGLEGANTFPRLGSPFAGRTRPSLYHSTRSGRHSPPRTLAHEPSLQSPVQLMAPLPFPSALKRRAAHQLEDELSPGGSELHRNLFEELFGAPADSSHRRVRSRGFSLGDVSEGSRLSSLVTPPAMYDQMNSSEFATASSFAADAGIDKMSVSPEPGRTQRLGSPFEGIETRQDLGGHGQRPSIHLQPLPSRGAFAEAVSIEERLGLGQGQGQAPGAFDVEDASRKRMRG